MGAVGSVGLVGRYKNSVDPVGSVCPLGRITVSPVGSVRRKRYSAGPVGPVGAVGPVDSVGRKNLPVDPAGCYKTSLRVLCVVDHM